MRSTQGVCDQDAELINRTARGDESAFEELVTRHQHSVLNLVYRYVGDRGEAEDIAQEVFIKVWRHARGFEGKSRFTTWLYRIVVNQCLNHRGKRRGSLVSLDETLENGRFPDGLKTDIDLEHREKARILRRAVDELPKNQRMALMLASYEGRSYREISDIMGLSLSSVTSLIFRAKDGLRKRLLPLRVNGDI